jgi:hypothetical protein
LPLGNRPSANEFATDGDGIATAKQADTSPFALPRYQRHLHPQKTDLKMINNLRDPVAIYSLLPGIKPEIHHQFQRYTEKIQYDRSHIRGVLLSAKKRSHWSIAMI